MPFQTVNPTPNTDDFSDLYTAHNANANQSVDNANLNGNTLQLVRQGGGIIPVIIPNFPNQLNSGLIVTTNPTTAFYTAGTYQMNNRLYSVTGGSFAVSTPSAGNSRIDAIVAVDDLSPPTGTIQYITGTEAVNPSAPTLLSSQLLVAYIFVDDTNPPVVQPPQTCCVPDGTVLGDTLYWNGTKWAINPMFTHSQSAFILTAVSGGSIEMSSGTSAITEGWNGLVNTLTYVDGSKSIQWTHGNLGGGEWGSQLQTNGVFNIDSAQGIYIKPNSTPGSTNDKLYNVGGNLYWDGNQICLAPCGGGGSLSLPTGTVAYSTINWFAGSGQWIENTFNRFNGGTWATIAFGGGISAPGAGKGNIVYAGCSTGSATFNVDANASVMVASGCSNSYPAYIQHTAPGVGQFKGYNGQFASFESTIDLDAQIGGAFTLGANRSFINKSGTNTGEGFIGIIASKQATIAQHLNYDLILASIFPSMAYAEQCVIVGSSAACSFTSSTPSVITQDSGIYNSSACEIRSYSSGVATKQTQRSMITGSQSCNIYGARISLIQSSSSSSIRSYYSSPVAFSNDLACINITSCSNCQIQQFSSAHTGLFQNLSLQACSSVVLDSFDYQCNNVFVAASSGNIITIPGDYNNWAVIARNSAVTIRPNTFHTSSIEAKGNLYLTNDNIVNASGLIPNEVCETRVTVAGTTQTLPSNPYHGEEHIIVSDFTGALTFTTVQRGGTILINAPGAVGVTSLTVPGDYGCLVLRYNATLNYWIVKSKNY